MRWADMDLLGHVNNVVYVDYLQEARVDMLRTHGPAAQTGELAEGVVVVRHEVHYRAPLTFRFRPVEHRVLGDRDPGCVVHDGLRGLPGDRRAGAGSTCGRHGADAVRVRHRAAAPARAEEKSRRWTTFLEPEEPAAAVRRDPGRGTRSRPLPGARAVLRRRRLRPRQQREVLRVLPGGPDPDDRAALEGHARRDARAVASVVAQTDVDYRLPILFRPEPYDAWSWISHVGERSMTIESEICDGDTVLSRARVVMVFFDPKTARGGAAAEAYRERLLGVVAG